MLWESSNRKGKGAPFDLKLTSLLALILLNVLHAALDIFKQLIYLSLLWLNIYRRGDLSYDFWFLTFHGCIWCFHRDQLLAANVLGFLLLISCAIFASLKFMNDTNFWAWSVLLLCLTIRSLLLGLDLFSNIVAWVFASRGVLLYTSFDGWRIWLSLIFKGVGFW